MNNEVHATLVQHSQDKKRRNITTEKKTMQYVRRRDRDRVEIFD
jgi:hypothetical protein